MNVTMSGITESLIATALWAALVYSLYRLMRRYQNEEELREEYAKTITSLIDLLASGEKKLEALLLAHETVQKVRDLFLIAALMSLANMVAVTSLAVVIITGHGTTSLNALAIGFSIGLLLWAYTSVRRFNDMDRIQDALWRGLFDLAKKK